MNRKVKITLKDTRTINNKKTYMEIYCNDDLIIKTYIINDYVFIANTKKIYIVKIYTDQGIKTGVIKHNNTLDFIITNCLIENKKVTLYLTDYNYPNYKIERGTLYLWTKRI